MSIRITWLRTSSAQIFWLACKDLTHHSTNALEAAELFALLARVDLALWKEMACVVWPHAYEWADYIETRTSVRVGVDVQVEHAEADLPAVCTKAVAYLQSTRANEYHKTRALMARVLNVPRESLSIVPLRINYIAGSENASVASLLANVVDAFQSLPSVQFPAMQVTHFKTETICTTVDEAAIKRLAAIQALGIEVTELPMIQADAYDQNRQPFLQSYRTLLGASAFVPQAAAAVPSRYVARTLSRSSRNGRTAGAEKIAVHSALPDELYSSIFSAVHASRSLKAIDVSFEKPTEDASNED